MLTKNILKTDFNVCIIIIVVVIFIIIIYFDTTVGLMASGKKYLKLQLNLKMIIELKLTSQRSAQNTKVQV